MITRMRTAGSARYKLLKRPFEAFRWFWRGLNGAESAEFVAGESVRAPVPNDLEVYFDMVQSGPGIWKWRHYFDIYDRHFQKFRNREVNILEIGIYSGGSLGMWRAYFGPQCHIYGVDIKESCKVYADERISVLIGDQADLEFWRRFKERVPRLDVIVDDGGHRTDQQVATLEEMLPYLRPGGVYLCEDVHGENNNLNHYINALSCKMNIHRPRDGGGLNNNERRMVAEASLFQSNVHSIHIYPYVVVIERREQPIDEFVAPKHGTLWEPFLK